MMLCGWLLVVLATIVGSEEVHYIGAVLELEPYSSWEAGGESILKENARIFLEYATIASQEDADIIVFPEYGLTSTNLEGGDLLTLAQVVPQPSELVVPCLLNQTDNHTQVLGVLSCGAAQLDIYMVVDLIELDYCNFYQSLECPNEGYNLYNTQVVLDRSGMVIARYRKKHLFLEPEFTPGTEDSSSAIFSTDFGVTFSLQICFDIMYEYPGVANVENGVYDVAMSTAWIDELPFLTAPQIFQGWSTGLGVNLLVANYHNPEVGMLGSGLFPGVSGEESLYTYDHNGGTTLLLAPMKTINCSNCTESKTKTNLDLDQSKHEKARPERPLQDMIFIHEDLSQYSSLLLDQNSTNSPTKASLCHNDSLCCDVTYTIPTNFSMDSNYMLLAYSGLVEKGGGVYTLFTQVCSVVLCLTDDINSCARIEEVDIPASSGILLHELSGVFRVPNIFPSLMRLDFTLVEKHLWNYDKIPQNDKQYEAKIHVVDDSGPLLSVTLMGRWYQRDLLEHANSIDI